jgi:hypothetical protein
MAALAHAHDHHAAAHVQHRLHRLHEASPRRCASAHGVGLDGQRLARQPRACSG